MAHPDPHTLRGIASFAGLSDDQIGDIIRRGRLRHREAGSQVFRAGDPADLFFLLLDGVIRAVRTLPSGDQVVPIHVPAGELFGMAIALGHSAYPATTIAVTDCVTMEWPSGLWVEFVASCPAFGVRSNAQIGKRMEYLHEQIAALATRSVNQRLALALLRLADQVGKPTEEGMVINMPITRNTLSEMTGTTLHSASRVLSAWEKQGIVTSDRRRMIITDVNRLLDISTDA